MPSVYKCWRINKRYSILFYSIHFHLNNDFMMEIAILELFFRPHLEAFIVNVEKVHSDNECPNPILEHNF